MYFTDEISGATSEEVNFDPLMLSEGVTSQDLEQLKTNSVKCLTDTFFKKLLDLEEVGRGEGPGGGGGWHCMTVILFFSVNIRDIHQSATCQGFLMFGGVFFLLVFTGQHITVYSTCLTHEFNIEFAILLV